MERAIQALEAAGARLKRVTNHIVYELPNGQNVTMARSPSDHRAERNVLRDIRHATGAVGQPKSVTVPKKPRAAKLGRVEPERWSPLAAALKDSGVVQHVTEQKLRWRILELEGDLAAMRTELHIAQRALATIEGLRIVRLWRWWNS